MTLRQATLLAMCGSILGLVLTLTSFLPSPALQGLYRMHIMPLLHLLVNAALVAFFATLYSKQQPGQHDNRGTQP